MTKEIIAAVVLEESSIRGGVPIFATNNEEEQYQVTEELGRLLRADIHRLSNGIMVLMRTIE